MPNIPVSMIFFIDPGLSFFLLPSKENMNLKIPIKKYTKPIIKTPNIIISRTDTRIVSQRELNVIEGVHGEFGIHASTFLGRAKEGKARNIKNIITAKIFWNILFTYE